MSLMMWSHGTEGIQIVSDTLAVVGNPAKPASLHTKVWPIPHLNLVIGGTGAITLLEWWHIWVTTAPVPNLEILNKCASIVLPAFWEDIQASRLDDDGSSRATPTGETTTIYHFAIDSSGRPISYTYRSTEGFAPQVSRKAGMLYFKPHPPAGMEMDWQSIPQIIETAERIRANQRTKPESEQVHIGGELHLTTVRPGEISTAKIHRFSDYDRHTRAIASQGFELHRYPASGRLALSSLSALGAAGVDLNASSEATDLVARFRPGEAAAVRSSKKKQSGGRR